MSYPATVFNVMIACPGDVQEERKIIRDVIHEWNDVHSESRSVVLLPIDWKSHSSPEMGSSPQEIINGQVLDKCDLLVGVFWTRIGTPTNSYASGTVEEIEKHIETGKPVMLYFSGQPVVMETVDLEQVRSVRQFKDSCGNRCLYVSYDSLDDFKGKFSRQLQIKTYRDPLFTTTGAEAADAILKAKTHLPRLTDSARVLLKEASQDSQGIVMHLRYLNGTELQTNGKDMIQSNERRAITRWESVLEELIRDGLLVARGNKGEVAEVTDLGYQVAELL